MKKFTFILKYCIYYIIGLISFSIIAFITHKIVISILLRTVINPLQDLYNMLNYILVYSPYYIVVYTLLYFFILYAIQKYDKYTVNKLNEKLEQVKNYNEKK